MLLRVRAMAGMLAAMAAAGMAAVEAAPAPAAPAAAGRRRGAHAAAVQSRPAGKEKAESHSHSSAGSRFTSCSRSRLYDPFIIGRPIA